MGSVKSQNANVRRTSRLFDAFLSSFGNPHSSASLGIFGIRRSVEKRLFHFQGKNRISFETDVFVSSNTKPGLDGKIFFAKFHACENSFSHWPWLKNL